PNGPFSLAHELERADHRADLVMQEGPRRSLDRDFLSSPVDGEPVEGLHRRSRLAFRGAEGGEIVVTHQDLRRLMHDAGIERVDYMPSPVAVEGKRPSTVDDAIKIMPRKRREARVEILRGVIAAEHADGIGPEQRVESI